MPLMPRVLGCVHDPGVDQLRVEVAQGFGAGETVSFAGLLGPGPTGMTTVVNQATTSGGHGLRLARLALTSGAALGEVDGMPHPAHPRPQAQRLRGHPRDLPAPARAEILFGVAHHRRSICSDQAHTRRYNYSASPLIA